MSRNPYQSVIVVCFCCYCWLWRLSKSDLSIYHKTSDQSPVFSHETISEANGHGLNLEMIQSFCLCDSGDSVRHAGRSGHHSRAKRGPGHTHHHQQRAPGVQTQGDIFPASKPPSFFYVGRSTQTQCWVAFWKIYNQTSISCCARFREYSPKSQSCSISS